MLQKWPQFLQVQAGESQEKSQYKEQFCVNYRDPTTRSKQWIQPPTNSKFSNHSMTPYRGTVKTTVEIYDCPIRG